MDYQCHLDLNRMGASDSPHTWTISSCTLWKSCSSILFIISSIQYWESNMINCQDNIEYFSRFMMLEDGCTLSLDYFERKTSLVNLLQSEPCQLVQNFTFPNLIISSTHPSQVQGWWEMTHTPIWMSGTVTHVQPDNNSVKCWAANVTRVSEIKVSNLAVVIDVECQTHTTTVLVLVSSCQVSLILCLIQFCNSEFSSVVVPCYI